jgi:hypothetical protein
MNVAVYMVCHLISETCLHICYILLRTFNVGDYSKWTLKNRDALLLQNIIIWYSFIYFCVVCILYSTLGRLNVFQKIYMLTQFLDIKEMDFEIYKLDHSDFRECPYVVGFCVKSGDLLISTYTFVEQLNTS